MTRSKRTVYQNFKIQFTFINHLKIYLYQQQLIKDKRAPMRERSYDYVFFDGDLQRFASTLQTVKTFSLLYISEILPLVSSVTTTELFKLGQAIFIAPPASKQDVNYLDGYLLHFNGRCHAILSRSTSADYRSRHVVHTPLYIT